MRSAAWLCWLILCPAVAEPALYPNALVLHFQANASRLSPEALGQLDRLAEQVHGDVDLHVIVATPSGNDPRRNRLLAAREVELRRHFQTRAMLAEFQADAQAPDDDSLTLTLRRTAVEMPVAAATATAESMAEQTSSPLWQVEPGPSLRAVLRDWAGQAGWTVVWQSSYDYPVQAPAQLRGDFATILPQLLGGFSAAKPPPSARIFAGNHVVIIE